MIVHAAANHIVHLICSATYVEIVIPRGLRKVEDVIEPIEVAIIMVAAILGVDNNPWSCRIFCHVVSTFFQHFVVIGIQSRVATARCSCVKLIYQSCYVVTRGHEFGLCCWCREAETTVIADVRLPVFVAFGGDKHHAEACTRTVNGCRGSIFKHRNALDIVGIDAVDAAFYTVDKH